MDDLEYSRFYWEFVDRQEDLLQHYIYSLDISQLVTEVFQRFSDLDLNQYLSWKEVVQLHRQIKVWLEEGLDEKTYRLILQYFARKKRIKQREALSLWLLAAICVYYQRILQKSISVFLAVAKDSYEKIWKESYTLTKIGEYHPPDNIDHLMNIVNPAIGSTLTQRLWADAQYFRDVLMSRLETLALEEEKFHANYPAEQKRFARMEDLLLKRSEKTKAEQNGHHGLLDKQLTFVVGYTVLKAFRDVGVKRYKFIATLDDRTTDSCENLHGKIFSIEEAKLGVNVPPIANPPHPCRSVIRAVSENRKEVYHD